MSQGTREFILGPLSFRLDFATGFVRNIRFAGEDILRGIYPAVRDSGWGTVVPQVDEPVIQEHPDRLHIRMSGTVVRGNIDFRWIATLEAEARGNLRYHWQGQAHREFETSRTGLCVLHPAEAAGAPCSVEHTDGRRVAGWLPVSVSPHQPFVDVRAITHVVGPVETTVRFEGEVFEMEDQRNWSDASFKTYCRPLAWPWPYRLKAGEAVTHTVTMTARARPSAPRPKPAAHATVITPGSLPRLGFTISEPLPASLQARLRALRPAHLRVDTDAARIDHILDWAPAECHRLDCELLMAIRDATTAPPKREAFPAQTTVHLFDARGNTATADVVSAWHDAGFSSIGTGTVQHFAQLNRNRPTASGPHTEVTFGINAQVHAFDDTSILETVSQHNVLARQARAIAGGGAVSIAPLDFGPAAGSTDPRLHSDFGALWLLGSLTELAAAGVERVTFSRTHGLNGILQEDLVSPIEAMLGSLARCTRSRLVEYAPGAAALHHALVVQHGDKREMLVPHLGDSATELSTPWVGPVRLEPRTLHRIPLPA